MSLLRFSVRRISWKRHWIKLTTSSCVGCCCSISISMTFSSTCLKPVPRRTQHKVEIEPWCNCEVTIDGRNSAHPWFSRATLAVNKALFRLFQASGQVLEVPKLVFAHNNFRREPGEPGFGCRWRQPGESPANQPWNPALFPHSTALRPEGWPQTGLWGVETFCWIVEAAVDNSEKLFHHPQDGFPRISQSEIILVQPLDVLMQKQPRRCPSIPSVVTVGGWIGFKQWHAESRFATNERWTTPEGWLHAWHYLSFFFLFNSKLVPTTSCLLVAIFGAVWFFGGSFERVLWAALCSLTAQKVIIASLLYSRAGVFDTKVFCPGKFSWGRPFIYPCWFCDFVLVFTISCHSILVPNETGALVWCVVNILFSVGWHFSSNPDLLFLWRNHSVKVHFSTKLLLWTGECCSVYPCGFRCVSILRICWYWSIETFVSTMSSARN